MKEHDSFYFGLTIGIIIGATIMYLILAFNKEIIAFNEIMGW